jgi:hypothetical protein
VTSRISIRCAVCYRFTRSLHITSHHIPWEAPRLQRGDRERTSRIIHQTAALKPRTAVLFSPVAMVTLFTSHKPRDTSSRLPTALPPSSTTCPDRRP